MKGSDSDFRPQAGTVCMASLPHEDDENGYVFFRTTILWRDDVFFCARRGENWPDVFKWEHVICKPLVLEKQQ